MLWVGVDFEGVNIIQLGIGFGEDPASISVGTIGQNVTGDLSWWEMEWWKMALVTTC